jgi:hypothetical protein
MCWSGIPVGVGEDEAGGREMAVGEQLDRPTTLEREGEEKPTTDSHGTVERATTTTKHEPCGYGQVRGLMVQSISNVPNCQIELARPRVLHVAARYSSTA